MSDIPAGWYPEDDGQLRYWDGSAWTDKRAIPSASTPAPQERKSHPLRVLIILGVLAIGGYAFVNSQHHKMAGEDLSLGVTSTLDGNKALTSLWFGFDPGAVSVSCNDVADMQPGAITDCTATSSDGRTINLRVTFDDDQGHFHVNKSF